MSPADMPSADGMTVGDEAINPVIVLPNGPVKPVLNGAVPGAGRPLNTFSAINCPLVESPETSESAPEPDVTSAGEPELLGPPFQLPAVDVHTNAPVAGLTAAVVVSFWT